MPPRDTPFLPPPGAPLPTYSETRAPSAPTFADADLAEAWRYYLVGQFENVPVEFDTWSDLPSSSSQPSPSVSQPSPSASPSSGAPSESTPSSTAAPSSASPSVVEAIGAVLAAPAQAAQRALQTGEEFFASLLEGPARVRAPEPTLFEEVLARPPKSDFERLLARPYFPPGSVKRVEDQLAGFSLKKLLPRFAAAMSRALDVAGPLPLLAPTLLGYTPISDRARADAEALARLQSPAWSGSTSARFARPMTAASIAASSGRATRTISPAPSAAPSVPHLPGLSPQQLATVLGESAPSAKPANFSRARALRDAAGRAPRSWADLAADVLTPVALDVGKTLAYRYLPEKIVDEYLRSTRPRRSRVRTSSTQPLSRLFVEPPNFTNNVPRLEAAPDASADTSPRTRRLTRSKRDLVKRDRCKCERPKPRPSDKVPTVRSYKRRMSQNSLDNLRRG